MEDILDEDEIEQKPLPTEKELAEVVKLAMKQIQIENDIFDLEEALRLKQVELKMIRETSLPLALTEMGLEGLPLKGGYGIKMKEIIAASIKRENRPEAMKWLRANDAADIIKNTVTVSFKKGEEKRARDFVRSLLRRKIRLDFEQDETVNHQTLGAYVRGLVKKARGENMDPRQALPFELFGVFMANVTDVERPKEDIRGKK